MIYKMRIFLLLFFLQSFLYGKAEEKHFRLFSDEMKTAYPSVVYDFLEHYLYKLDSLQTANPLAMNHLKQDKVIFKKGSPKTARKITPSHSFSLRIIDDKFYEAVWSDSTQKEILHMVFPVSFELILGMPKNKVERKMKQDLLATPKTFIADTVFQLEVKEYQSGVFIPTNTSYSEIKELNTNTYFSKNKNSKLFPIYDSKHLAYSSANLLQGIISNCNEYKLNIYQNLYDFQHEEYTITLSQWLNYCKAMHATVYLGVEEEREDGIKVLLLVHSHDLGFHHMLSIVLPWNLVEKPKAVLKAKLNAYIPTHNIMSIYQERLQPLLNKK